jgi:hypothetical protein
MIRWDYKLTCDGCGREHAGAYLQPPGSPSIVVANSDFALAQFARVSETESDNDWFVFPRNSVLCVRCAKAAFDAALAKLREIHGSRAMVAGEELRSGAPVVGRDGKAFRASVDY